MTITQWAFLITAVGVFAWLGLYHPNQTHDALRSNANEMYNALRVNPDYTDWFPCNLDIRKYFLKVSVIACDFFPLFSPTEDFGNVGDVVAFLRNMFTDVLTDSLGNTTEIYQAIVELTTNALTRNISPYLVLRAALNFQAADVEYRPNIGTMLHVVRRFNDIQPGSDEYIRRIETPMPYQGQEVRVRVSYDQGYNAGARADDGAGARAAEAGASRTNLAFPRQKRVAGLIRKDVSSAAVEAPQITSPPHLGTPSPVVHHNQIPALAQVPLAGGGGQVQPQASVAQVDAITMATVPPMVTPIPDLGNALVHPLAAGGGSGGADGGQMNVDQTSVPQGSTAPEVTSAPDSPASKYEREIAEVDEALRENMDQLQKALNDLDSANERKMNLDNTAGMSGEAAEEMHRDADDRVKKARASIHMYQDEQDRLTFRLNGIRRSLEMSQLEYQQQQAQAARAEQRRREEEQRRREEEQRRREEEQRRLEEERRRREEEQRRLEEEQRRLQEYRDFMHATSCNLEGLKCYVQDLINYFHREAHTQSLPSPNSARQDAYQLQHSASFFNRFTDAVFRPIFPMFNLAEDVQLPPVDINEVHRQLRGAYDRYYPPSIDDAGNADGAGGSGNADGAAGGGA